MKPKNRVDLLKERDGIEVSLQMMTNKCLKEQKKIVNCSSQLLGELHFKNQRFSSFTLMLYIKITLVKRTLKSFLLKK
jgi:hypothetical protein